MPAHREPDGLAIEAFEHDAGLPTDPDAPYLKTAMRLKTLGVPADMGALHDLTCAAYHPDTATKCHPGHTLGGIDINAWQAKALDAAVSAPLDEAGAATVMWQHANTLKSTAPDILTELHAEAHKAFRDANPGPGTFPTPTEISPTRFRRPYLTAGHADPGTGYGPPNTAGVPTEHIDASDYTRGPLTAGHADDSPANKGNGVIPAPIPAGVPQRAYYRTALRDAARSAMQAMHDHIAQTFPDLCPMTGPGTGGEPPIGQRPVPTPEGVGKTTKKGKAARVPRRADKARKGARPKPTAVKKSAAPQPAALSADIVKTAVADATTGLAEQVAKALKALKAEQKRSRRMQASLDALADRPDPAVIAFKGIGEPAATKTSGSPAGLPTVASIAAQQQLAVMRDLQQQAYADPDPAQREAAWTQLHRLNGLMQP